MTIGTLLVIILIITLLGGFLYKWCPRLDLNRHSVQEPAPKAGVSTNSTTGASKKTGKPTGR